MTTYTPPVDQLLTIGWPKDVSTNDWLDYAALGLAWEHAPELIRLMHDKTLEESGKDNPLTYGPMHATRALAQLGHEKAAQPFLDLLAVDPDNFGILDDVVELSALLGPGSLPAMEAHLGGEERIASSGAVCRLVGCLPIAFPETRDRAVAILTSELRKGDPSDAEESGFIVAYLKELKAVESADAIKEAYAKDCVADYICGSLGEVLYALGLGEKPPERERTTEWARTEGLPPPQQSEANPLSRAAEEKRKKDNKRKRQDQKKNRKRKK